MSLEAKLPMMYSCVHIAGRNPAECHMCHIDMNGGNSGINKPIGSQDSGFKLGGAGNIYKEYELDEEPKFALNERYDLSGHEDNMMLPTKPHLNVTVDNLDDLDRYGNPKTMLSGITSRKNLDGYKGLGKPHSLLLFPKDKYYEDD